MKFLLLLLLSFSCGRAFSQLQIEEKSKVHIAHSVDDLVGFAKTNQFDYALMGWYTSTWMSVTDEVYCLFRQQNTWYLAKISRTIGGLMTEPIRYAVKQRKLNDIEADSVRLILNAPLAFRYNLVDFDKLPSSCQYQKDGKTTGLIDVQDAATFHLLQISNQEIKSIYYYAPDEYLNRCYPYVKEFGILKGLVNTVSKLFEQTKDLKN